MTIDNNKISDIYQHGDKQEPPAYLDSTILSAAREALERDAEERKSVDAKHARSPFSGSWATVSSIAAVLVITVILVPLLTEEDLKTQDKLQAPDLVDDRQGIEMEQDMLYRLNAEQTAVQKQATKQKNEKAKKRMLLKARQPKLNSMKESELLLDSTEVPGRSEESLSEQKNVPQRTLPAASANRKSSSEPAVQSMRPMRPMQSMFNADIKRPDSPEKWLEKIRRLVEQGDTRAAQDELDRFRQFYPDQEIDQSILKLISGRLQ